MDQANRTMDGDKADLAKHMAGCAAGDRAALRAIYNAEAPRMVGIAMRILNNRSLAEDAVQEAMVQVWQNAARYNGALGSPRAWIYGIVRFRAIDILRNSDRVAIMDPQDLDGLRDATVNQAEDGLDPDGRLHHCLLQLHQDQRHAVLLIYVTGLTQAEIAGRLAKPLGTIKSWVKRSLSSLRECLT